MLYPAFISSENEISQNIGKTERLNNFGNQFVHFETFIPEQSVVSDDLGSGECDQLHMLLVRNNWLVFTQFVETESINSTTKYVSFYVSCLSSDKLFLLLIPPRWLPCLCEQKMFRLYRLLFAELSERIMPFFSVPLVFFWPRMVSIWLRTSPIRAHIPYN